MGLTEEVPGAVEARQCPTCLSGLIEGGEASCPRCRAPGSRTARPLPLLERELQARIEARTAAGFRQRRRAAKVARRIASLPATLFEPDAARSMDSERFAAATVTPDSTTVVDLPASAVLNVRSTAVVAEPAELLISTEAVSPAEPVMSSAPVAPRVRRRRRTVAATRCASVIEEPAPVIEEPAPVIEEPAPVIEEPAPVIEEPASVIEEPASVIEEPAPKLASVTRIGPQGTNPVWKDRVFNSARRTQPAATWPRPRPPVTDRATEPVNRWGGAAG